MGAAAKENRYGEILGALESLSDPIAVAGMARFGINPHRTYGISIPNLRRIARQVGKDHRMAERLWRSGIHEARILASMIDDESRVTEEQMERWVKGFDSWDVCDQCCGNLFGKTRFAYKKAVQWSSRKEEFVKRAAFSIMASLAFRDGRAKDKPFLEFLSIIKRESLDDRNFVKKAVNWALRQIGKRNLELNRSAVRIAREIYKIDSRSSRWIASDALRELTGMAVIRSLKR